MKLKNKEITINYPNDVLGIVFEGSEQELIETFKNIPYGKEIEIKVKEVE